MICNGSQEGFSEGGASNRAPECCRCGAVIAGPVYVALLNLKEAEPLDGWDEDYWVTEEFCANCFGDQPVRTRGRCVRCDREIATSAHVSGAARTYCSRFCRWASEDDRHEERHRDARTKTCGWCGTTFVASRADAFWCSGRCRVAAHRARTASPCVERAGTSPFDTPCATVTGDV